MSEQLAGQVSALRKRHRVPDILDVIAQLSNDEVPTPPVLARALLNLLPEHVWSQPDYQWLNPASKSGAILREVAARLMIGLASWEPDPQKRIEHIMTKMLFGCAITTLTGEMTRRSVYLSRDASSEHAAYRFGTPDGNLPFVAAEHDHPADTKGRVRACTVCGAPPGLERGPSRENYAYAFIHGTYPTEEMHSMKFDVIVANPPYQIGVEDNTRSRPLYQMFVQNALALNPHYCAMIVPSRWFTGGLGLDSFRDAMINDRRLRSIVDNPKVYDCFPGVKIRGGVNYFLWDRDHDGSCEFSTRIDGQITSTTVRDLRNGEGVLVRDNLALSIVDKVQVRGAERAEAWCSPTLPFGLRDNSSTRISPEQGDIPVIHGNRIGYVNVNDIPKNAGWVKDWKVLVPRASSGDTAQDESGRIIDVVLGAPIAVAPGSICTLTYIVAGRFGGATETRNYAGYLATKFARFLILQRKVTQDTMPLS